MMYDILGKILHKLALIKDDYLLNAMQKELGHNEGTISLKCHFKWPQHISIGKNSYINGGYMQSAGSNRRFCGAKRTRCGASGLNLYLLKSADTL